MAVCPSCGTDNPDVARFCMVCATPLDQAPQPQAEERKVVSVLFVDLVGFTARSHDADPEDVRAALAPYHQRLKREIEAFGGTVEKFIGDAVMAVFGAPVAHEDDAERGVRAALRIAEAIEELNEATPNLDLSIRAAVNTGEGLVTLGARPQSGEGMVTGDVVNTASRLQGIAPVGGVAVGEVTYRSTKDFIVYEEMEPVAVKGKPEPLPVWRAVSARSRFGVDVETRYRTPFIGRDFDLATLKTAYQRTLRESSLQMVTVVGEPGVGKSRLLAEFASYVDEQEEIVYWRQGRSLPYGEGITFWALGEIVKAQAGINESDSPKVASDKVAAAVGVVVGEESDRAWLEARLAPLVGATTTGGTAEKEESFTAWLRFLEAIAAKGPLVLVFEDLHWADASMLEFIEHVVEWSTGVPILIVCTARPELFEKHSAWAAGSRNATTISLSPLTDSETAQLISALLSQAVLPAEIHAALLERAGGNPLYAEEFIRMLSDRGILVRRGRALSIDPDADIPLPDSVQAIIAARLDTLSPERKSLLHDAAVAGKVFWSGAVGAIGGIDDAVVKEGLHELVRKELVRPARVSSMAGQQEYSFWHALVRDVCYGQIPRAARGRRHQAMAGWVEKMAGERVADHAEVLAHHYSEALTLASATGASGDKRRLLTPTKRFAALAGDRAASLDAPRALAYYEAALALMPPAEPARGRTLLRAGQVLTAMGSFSKAETYLREAVELLSGSGGHEEQADAMRRLSILLGDHGRTDEQTRLLDEARVLLERHGPSSELVRTYISLAYHQSLSLGAFQEMLTWSSKAISLARDLGAESLEADALCCRGYARCGLGDSGGLRDLRVGAARSEELNAPPSSVNVSYTNLGDAAWLFEGPKEGLEAKRHAFDFSSRRGMAGDAMWAKAESLAMLFDLGEWDQLLNEADEVLGWSMSREAGSVEIRALPYRCVVLAFRGNLKEALVGEERLRLILRKGVEPWAMIPALAIAANTRSAAGDVLAAVRLVTQFAEATEGRQSQRAWFLPNLMRVLAAAEEPRLAERIMVEEADVGAIRDKNSALTAKAILLEARGQIEEPRNLYEEAAQRWADYGFVLEEGQAHLGHARCLIALGDREAATDPLHKARAIFERLGAVPLINETDSYLRAEAAS